jgi:hypothetical protein
MAFIALRIDWAAESRRAVARSRKKISGPGTAK